MGLNVLRCERCGSSWFDHRVVCASCRSEELEPNEVAATGSIYSYSRIPSEMDPEGEGYSLAYIDLDGGVRVLARAVVPDGALVCDARVRVIEQDGAIVDGKHATPTYSFELMVPRD